MATEAHEIARKIIEGWRLSRYTSNPPAEGALVSWRSEFYIGGIQVVAPEFSQEIVLLSKSSNSVDPQLVRVIKDLEGDNGLFKEYGADGYLDLTGRQHILRRLDRKLTKLTPEQTRYMLLNPMNVKEVNIHGPRK
jgi:hypothetical protein